MTKAIINLSASLKVQYRILKALILREIITRWGRNNIGFLWLFADQILAFIFYGIFWLLRGVFFNNIWAKYNVSIIAFIVLGHATLLMWKNAGTLAQAALWSNTALFHHSKISTLDFYLSRILLEIISATGSFLLSISVLILLRVIPLPKDIPYTTLAWCYSIWFTVGFSLTIGVLVTQYEFLKKPWTLIIFILFLSSGPLMGMEATIPKKYFQILILLPSVQLNEMLRHGYYGSTFKTYEDLPYISLVNFIMLAIGLFLVKIYGKNLPQRL